MKSIVVSKIWLWLSIFNSGLVLAASFLGVLNDKAYSLETPNWAMQARGQDIGNLFAVLLFLISTYLLHKKSLKAYCVWVGTLFYLIYAYIIYSFFIHFNYLFLVYILILGISFFTLVGGLVEQQSNTSNLLKSLSGKRMKSASILLVIIGVLFGFLWLSEIIAALLLEQQPKSIIAAGLWVNPIQVIDLALVLPGMILTGILLWRKKLLGYLFAAPWLTFSALMGLSIVVTMIMEIVSGNAQAIAPLVMVGGIVIASITVLVAYLGKINGEK